MEISWSPPTHCVGRVTCKVTQAHPSSVKPGKTCKHKTFGRQKECARVVWRWLGDFGVSWFDDRIEQQGLEHPRPWRDRPTPLDQRQHKRGMQVWFRQRQTYMPNRAGP